MTKLLKNEWLRYRLAIIIIIAVTAGLGVLLSGCLLISDMWKDNEFMAGVAGMGSSVMIIYAMLIIPYAGYIFTIISYATDIGKKGMIFLTPTPTWKVILSKLLFGLGLYVVLFAETKIIIALVSLQSESMGNEEVTDLFEIMTSVLDFSLYAEIFSDSTEEAINPVLSFIASFIVGIVSTLMSALQFMACIALARYSANSVGVQVVLVLVFNWIIGIIQSVIVVLAMVILAFVGVDLAESVFFTQGGITAVTAVGGTAYSVLMYFICTKLTDKKVNLVS